MNNNDVNTPTGEHTAESITAEFKDYAYSVAHDLSKPARAMVEFSKLLGTEYGESLNDEAKEYLSLITESGVKLQQMMDGLLDYSRLNTMAKPLTKVDANRLLEDCQIILQDKIKSSKAIIEASILPPVRADIDQLTQLFLVLLDNAIKFQKPDNVPHIKISALQQKDKVCILIADNGIGIAPEFRASVFHLFRRLHTDEEFPGVGMGLSLAQKIVQRHGGIIECVQPSLLKPGITFQFTLPSGEP